MTMLDPWDRAISAQDRAPLVGGPVQPRVFTLPTRQFCELWNYSETHGNTTLAPYFGVYGAPWEVRVTFDEGADGFLHILAHITYTVPPAFLDTARAYPALAAYANISLPPTLALASGSQQTQALGDMQPGTSTSASWRAQSSDGAAARTPPQPSVIAVGAAGSIRGNVPAMQWGAGITRPAYQYADLIGGNGFVAY